MQQESFTDLLYPCSMSEWLTYLSPVNATRPWLEKNTIKPYAPYITKKVSMAIPLSRSFHAPAIPL